MACYFCRNIEVDLQKHDKCNKQATICPQCGKCHHCNKDTLKTELNNQKYALQRLNARKFAIVYLEIATGIARCLPGDTILGNHRTIKTVPNCENLNFETAKMRLADLLYNPDSEWKV